MAFFSFAGIAVDEKPLHQFKESWVWEWSKFSS